MFLVGADSFMFDGRSSRCDTDIDAWARRWMPFRKWSPGRLKNVFVFDIPIVRHIQEMN